MTGVVKSLLWPVMDSPDDLAGVESIPLGDRALPASTYSLLQRAASLWPDRDAVITLPDATHWSRPVRRTYIRLLADVDATAQLLHDNGIRRDNAVALMSPNCDELITATLAAQAAGVVAPVNSGLTADRIADLVGRAGATVLIAAGPELDADVWAAACEVAERCSVTTVFALRPTGARGEPEALSGPDGITAAYLSDAVTDGSRFVGEPPRTGDLAAFFHTGGTTGHPKLAAHTHLNEVANAWMVSLSSTLDDGATLFAALPLFHVNALVVTLLAPMFRGQTVVWAGPLGYRDLSLYSEFWKIVEHYRIAAMSAVPTVYSVLAHCAVDADISSLTSCIVGASALPAAVRTSFEEHTGVALLQGYGLTEATCASARSLPDVPRHDAVGQRFPYQQIAAVRVESDGTRTCLPVGETGILEISGPTVFAGYVSERTDAGHVLDGLGTLHDGWVDTGDLGRVDAEGFVHLTGRAKDLIIRGGHNIDPTLIEDALLAHPAVTGAAAVGAPDPHSGEVPVAYVTVWDPHAVSAADIVVWARDRVAEAAAAPRSVTVVSALPLTDVGKPYKIALRADATRLVVVAALEGLVDADGIDTTLDNGTVSVVVDVPHSTDGAAIDAILSRYTVPWRAGTTT
ncbi:acyl-CoA synthetase [Rhodococcus sp. BP-241]|uniref:acyl-CoA synthetase n=1 Tax=Rhodococcus sp. BP-241 TaxID=2739441 RepID=UPI001C9B780B|nr:acyl-CoA synthetase [Rhodococcus sp. BP-241]MBY6708764.1 acyl-CoA synthetase [Rhodococcus sp. BP-241]